MIRTAFLILATVAGSAFATNKPEPPPAQTQPAATARAAAGATSASSASSNATQAQESAAAGGSGGSVDSRWAAIALPAPAFTPPMAALPCPAAQIEQGAWQAGWNFVGQATSRTDTRDCTAVIVINSLLERCQYGRAQRALDLLAVRALPGFEAQPVGYPDLTPAECALLRLPPVPARLDLIPPAAPKAPAVRKPQAKAAACQEPARRTGATMVSCM